MRERYEGEEGFPGRGGDPGRRRDESERGRPEGWEDEAGRRGYRSEADRWDEGRRVRDDAGDDWGDVQIGRWGGRRPPPQDEPGRWQRNESYWSGTSGRWARDLEREPTGARARPGDERRGWRYGALDFDREWQSQGRPQRPEGRFGGVGPKGYQRSDDRIREDVCDRLTADAYVDPSDVVVRVKEGEVTLEGTIDARETKRRIEDTVEDVAGVREVHNFLHVRSARGGPAGAEPGIGPGTPQT
jgi:hypothetical protein